MSRLKTQSETLESIAKPEDAIEHESCKIRLVLITQAVKERDVGGTNWCMQRGVDCRDTKDRER